MAYLRYMMSRDSLILAAENNLSFMETSALDASNVESAFQTILTGKYQSIVSASGVTHWSRRHLPHCVEQVTGAVC